ncbi:MAG: Obg family GTPase CgtA [Gammaproteobacteria bacterium]|nr:Obg family GTPase CgtA [Gammaproteobacteria bacterium]
MLFVDEVTLELTAGRGGDGCMSFHRGPNLPKGGPDGGNGGDGGNIVFTGDRALNTLVDFRYRPMLKSPNGRSGGSGTKTGAKGQDLVLAVPCGTSVVDADTLEYIADITTPEQAVIVAKGGQGGRGNHSFRSSTNRAPREFESGSPGEHKRLRLHLKVLADVGLLGKPNAGKSTLLSTVSASKPTIADYPFTTLIPNLGVVKVDAARSFVMADIPGLIEGAAEGHGLGTRFLKHLSRTQLLLHLVEAAPLDGTDPCHNLAAIERELGRFSTALANRTIWTVVTKTDVISQDALDAIVDRLRAVDPIRPLFQISAVTQRGVREMIFALMAAVEQHVDETTSDDAQLASDVLDDILSRTKPQSDVVSGDEDDVEVVYRRG